MTTVAVQVPTPGTARVVASLAEETPLTETAARELLWHVAADAVVAVAESGGDLVVVHPPPGNADADAWGWTQPGEAVQQLVEEALPEDEGPAAVLERPPDAVGELLVELDEAGEAASSAILRPHTPLVQRRHVDAAAMGLRRHDLVLGPTTGLTWYFLGTSGGFEFAPDGDVDHLTAVALGAAEAGGETDLLQHLPGIHGGVDLSRVLSILEAAELADKPTAPNTRAWLDEAGWQTDPSDPTAGIYRP